MLARRHLWEYLSESRRNNYGRANPTEEKDVANAPSHVINMIFDGSMIAKTNFTASRKMKILVTREKRTREFPDEDVITFSNEDASDGTLPHNDALVITVLIGNCQVKQFMIDPGSSANILHWKVVEEIGNDTGCKSALRSGCGSPSSEGSFLVQGAASRGWTLYTYRASNVKGTGLGVVLRTPTEDVLRQAINSVPLTNNEAEYKVLIAGLEPAWGFGAEVIEAKCGSLLVLNQVHRVFEAKEERMLKYLEKVLWLLARFQEWTVVHVPREENIEADALANLGSSTESTGPNPEFVVQLLHSALDQSGYKEVNSTSFVCD
ncbi:uncharacterized protein LOC132039413 [Lycium ferocissimum]|uniref:uncharacterized protein LOC132039413 n=1 Tax=Lycium ferocissimum TaxID=112874 RepID=UPI002814D116|nr:uncharacterized protein LOC132039413 [Lycium ferocissimum]